MDATIKVVMDMMDDDMSRVAEAADDAQMMVEAGADFGSTRAQLMAEYIMSVIVKMNRDNPRLTEWVEWVEANDDAINDRLAALIESKGW